MRSNDHCRTRSTVKLYHIFHCRRQVSFSSIFYFNSQFTRNPLKIENSSQAQYFDFEFDKAWNWFGVGDIGMKPCNDFLVQI